jgi:hypothetical protein
MPKYVPGPDTPEAFTRLVQGIIDRLTRLESKPTTRSDVPDGYFAVRDSAGQVRVEWGKFADGQYGVRVYNASGTAIFDQSEA